MPKTGLGILLMLKSLLSKFAPVLGGLIGGPLGVVATKAVAEILLPGEHTTDEKRIEEALKHSTPQQRAAIEKVNADYKVSIAKIELDDRKNARNREILTNDRTPRVLAYILTFCFIALCFLNHLTNIIHLSPGNPQMNDALQDSFLFAMSYYLGKTSK